MVGGARGAKLARRDFLHGNLSAAIVTQNEILNPFAEAADTCVLVAERPDGCAACALPLDFHTCGRQRHDANPCGERLSLRNAAKEEQKHHGAQTTNEARGPAFRLFHLLVVNQEMAGDGALGLMQRGIIQKLQNNNGRRSVCLTVPQAGALIAFQS
jgi:hypothetical protein